MHTFVQYAVDALSLGSLYSLYALGIAVVFGIVRLINFAHGELIMIAAFSIFVTGSQPLVVRLLVAGGITVVAALLMERLAFRPIRGASDSTLLITSFAVSFFLQNLFISIYGSLPKSTAILPSLGRTVTVGGISIQRLDIATIAITAVSLGALVLFFSKTSMGIQMRAAAENFRMARCLGVRANRVIAMAFAISGLLAALGAVILVAQGGLVSPTMGVTPVFAAFVATILGGLGRLYGAVLGAYLLGTLTVAFQAVLPLGARSYRDAFVFGALLLILVVRPQGLLRDTFAAKRV